VVIAADYLIAEGKEMGQRDLERIQAQKAALDAYVRETAGNGGPAGEIAHAKKLLDSGDITRPEFEQIKRKALA
jgi:hypothetical protein